jgi:hypothetical protein
MLIFFRVLILLFASLAYADNNNMKLFPIDNYSQNTDMWISPSRDDYQTNLLDDDYQQERFYQLKHTYFGTANNDNSPWSPHYVRDILQQQTDDVNIANSILISLDQFDNTEQTDKLQYLGVNNRPYSAHWIEVIENNIDLDKLGNLKYSPNNRAIATTNLLLRGLPTNDPAYYSSTIPGEGYPFDNLQASAVYAGTPLYILSRSIDREWSLVLAPEYIGWVKSSGVAIVDNNFIQTWQKIAYANLAGIKKSNVSIVDTHNNFQFSGYVGMIFPLSHVSSNNYEILIPVRQANGTAAINHARLNSDSIAQLPLSSSPANFAMLIKSLQGRPYGWGNLGFYNDCSSEMKAIFTMFGFFMPRNSKNQALAGPVVDISKLSAVERSDYLIKHADPFLTLVHLPGHIFLYIGAYRNSNGTEFPLSYQQMWGLAPHDRSSRSVIGKSVFLPLLTSYPEDTDLSSELNNKRFELIYLKSNPDKPIKATLSQLLGG